MIIIIIQVHAFVSLIKVLHFISPVDNYYKYFLCTAHAEHENGIMA